MLRMRRCHHAPLPKCSGQLQCAGVLCLLPACAWKEARTSGKMPTKSRVVPEQGEQGWVSTPGGFWTQSCGGCRPHSVVAVSLLGLGGREEAATNRKDTHVSNENTAAGGSRSDALLMELFDASIFGEPLWSVQQHCTGGGKWGGLCWWTLTCSESTMCDRGPGRCPLPSPGGLTTPMGAQ